MRVFSPESPSQVAGNVSSEPSASHSPGSYARVARTGAQLYEIRKGQAAARRDRQNLDRTLQAVLARVSQVEERPSVANPFARAPKLGTLPKYSGKVDTIDLQDWLMQVQAQCSLQLGEEPGPFWVHMASSHLEGPALSHFNSFRAQRSAQGMPELSSWEEFMEVIKGGFEQYDPEDHAREALDQIRQGNRPVEVHQRAFRQHLSKLKSYQLPGQEVCRLFRKSLNSELQEKMAFDENGKRYEDIDTMIHMAVRKDTAKRESQREQVGGSAGGGAAGAGSSRGRSSSRGRGGNGRRGGRSFSPAASRNEAPTRQVTADPGGEWQTAGGKRKNKSGKGAAEQPSNDGRQQHRRGNHQGTISQSFGLTSAQAQERRRNFACYKCGSTDHFARDCPDKNKWCADSEKLAVSHVRTLTNKQVTLDVYAQHDGSDAVGPNFLSTLDDFKKYEFKAGHLWLHVPYSQIEAYMQSYHEHKFKNCSSISACVIVPEHARGHWRKYLSDMQLVHVCELPVKHVPGSADQGQERQKMQIYSDAVPAKLMLIDETQDEDEPLTMKFSGDIAEVPATIFIDDGASRNFISCKFVHWHKIVPDSEEEVEVSLAGDRTVGTQGSVQAMVHVQDYVAEQKFTVIELPIEFDAILGNAWCRSHAVHLDFEHQECVLQREGEKCVLHAIQDFPEWRTKAGKFKKASSHRQGIPIVHLNAMQCKRASHKKVPMFLALVKVAEDSVKVPGTDKVDKCPDEMRDILQEYAEVFPDDLPEGVPCRPPHVRTIELQEGAVPSSRPMYRLSPLELQEVKAQVEHLLKKGHIKPSCSPFGAPILFVGKKDGGLRMCIDYRALNKQTVKNKFPLPRIDDLLDKLQGARYSTSLDLQSGYHQIDLDSEETPKTAFRTPIGHFEFTVLPFGLTNAPATFQNVMNDMFSDMIDDFTVIYLDDILVYSKTKEEHKVHVQQVLQRLKERKYYAQLHKCRFCQPEVPYLGHVVGADGIKVDPKKTQAVQDFPEPKNVPELRSFLGLATYFRKFIHGFANLTMPLTALLKKEVPWKWSQKCVDACAGVKYALTHAPDPRLPQAF